MFVVAPKSIMDLIDVYFPYIEQDEKGCHLKEDAPLEAVEAYKKVKDWFEEFATPEFA